MRSIEEIASELAKTGDQGMYVGRLCPIQLGHQRLIEALTLAFPKRHLVALGSAGKPISYRHLFNYADRAEFVRAVFPRARVVPLPDFEEDAVWFRALDHLIEASGGDPVRTVFIGGCEEEMEYFARYGRKTHIVNRFAGDTPSVSGTEVRDALIGGRSLDGMLDARIVPLVAERFTLRWAELRRR